MKNKRKKDPFVDRRSGEDRRNGYDLEYFPNGGSERRSGKERRRKDERRGRCFRVSDWSSICPDEAPGKSQTPKTKSREGANGQNSKPAKRSRDSQ